MDLELDDEQDGLVSAVRGMLAKEWSASTLRAHVGGDAVAAALWARMIELDWPALCVPEGAGGMGFGPVESALVHEQCGAALTPGPLFATAAFYAPALTMLGDEGQRSSLLRPVAEGHTTGTVALTELVRSVAMGRTVDPTELGVRASADGEGGWRLQGEARSVIDAATADRVVVPARLEDDGVAAFVVPQDSITITDVTAVDETRRIANLSVDATVTGSERLAEVDGEPEKTMVRLVDHALVQLGAELVGTCSAILEIVLDHVQNREQFGVKIGSFQALKHRLADCYLDLEAARASVRFASVALAEGSSDASASASSAKALASDCARRLGQEGIQMLGGIGFTWEHDMHFFVKRAMSSAVLLGTAEDHRQRVARLMGLVPA